MLPAEIFVHAAQSVLEPGPLVFRQPLRCRLLQLLRNRDQPLYQCRRLRRKLDHDLAAAQARALAAEVIRELRNEQTKRCRRQS